MRPSVDDEPAKQRSLPFPPPPVAANVIQWLRDHPIWAILLLVVSSGGVIVGIRTYRLSRQVNLSGMIGPGGLAEVQVPSGFQFQVYARDLDGPRFIRFGPDGALYAAERGASRIVRLADEDQDGAADSIEAVAGELAGVHSLAFRDDALYTGVPTGVIRLKDTDGDGSYEDRSGIISGYPTEGHNTRTVQFLPTGELVVSIGSSCNSCVEEDSRRAALVLYEPPDFTSGDLYATGLRNAVGLAIQPSTGELWVTNNGRDLMGPDVPPDTVHLIRQGEDYGWPRCHAGRFPDPDLGSSGACGGVPAPEISLQAHSAPLGLTFYDGNQFPAEYRGDLFIAYHGSWNRDPPTGYKVIRVPFSDGLPSGDPVDFATGWFDPATGAVSGRPVGLVIGPDGSLYVSDDRGGFIYRISYGNQ